MTDEEILRAAAGIIGSRKSAAKTEAARANGLLGGRPRKTSAETECCCPAGAAELDATKHRAYCRRWKWQYARTRRAKARQATETTTEKETQDR